MGEPSPADYTDEQLRASGWNDQQILELRGTPPTTVSDVFESLGTSQQQDVIQNESTLPAFNCIVTGQVLTATDAWWQCSGCGGFAAASAIVQYTHCPNCNLER